MTHDTAVLTVHTATCHGRHEAYAGDSYGYSNVSRTDALQNLLSSDTEDSHAQHPHDWPDRGSPLHAAMVLLRGAL